MGLTFEEAFDKVPDCWLTEPEGRLLWKAASDTVGPILEIGSYRGRSTVLLAYLDRPLWSVDPFDGFDSTMSGDLVCSIFWQNITERNLKNVTQFRARIEDWHAPSAIEFAYLDGDHTFKGTLAQIESAIRAGAKRICIHDYSTSGDGKEIVDAIHFTKLIVLDIVERMAYCMVPSKQEARIELEDPRDFLFYREAPGSTIEITEITVGSVRGIGHGRELINKLAAELNPSFKLVFARTRISNEVARGFYEHIGFRLLGQLERFYPDTREDALVYGKDL